MTVFFARNEFGNDVWEKYDESPFVSPGDVSIFFYIMQLVICYFCRVHVSVSW